MGEDIEMTRWDIAPVIPAMHTSRFTRFDQARELQERYPDWIISYNSQTRNFCALSYKYLHRGWLLGSTPEFLEQAIGDTQMTEIAWDVSLV